MLPSPYYQEPPFEDEAQDHDRKYILAWWIVFLTIPDASSVLMGTHRSFASTLPSCCVAAAVRFVLLYKEIYHVSNSRNANRYGKTLHFSHLQIYPTDDYHT